MASFSLSTRPVRPLRAGFGLSSASTVALVAGWAAIAGYFLLPAHGHAQSVFYVVIGLSAVSAIFIGTLRNLPAGARLPWYLFGAGLLCQVAGDTIFAVYEVKLDREPPFPGIADAFYLSGYPLLTLGAFLVVRRLGGFVSRAAVLDTVAVFFGVALVQWVFFIDAYTHGGGSQSTRLVSMAYPAMDALLLVGFAQLLAGRGSRTAAYRLLLVSVALWLVADEIYGLHPDNYSGGSWIDALWLGSYVTWAAAALEPSVARIADADRWKLPRLTVRRLVLLAAALLTAPTVLLVERAAHHRIHATVIGIGAAAIALVVLLRLAGLVRAEAASRGAEQAARREAEQAERLLRFQNEQLLQLDQLKDEFVSSVSHELRTPLTSISGYVELLLDDEPSSTKQGYLKIIDRNADRLLGLVSDILFAARLQDGRLQLELEPVDLRRLIDHAVEEAGPRAEAASVELAVKADERLPVNGEEARLAQLLDNLVSNALKFTPAGGRVDITAASGDGLVRIEVSDTGIGVDPRERELLFERFFRSQTALERQIQGTGLGLYISKAIVEAHGGRIGVSSAEGEGATFLVELPASPS